MSDPTNTELMERMEEGRTKSECLGESGFDEPATTTEATTTVIDSQEPEDQESTVLSNSVQETKTRLTTTEESGDELVREVVDEESSNIESNKNDVDNDEEEDDSTLEQEVFDDPRMGSIVTHDKKLVENEGKVKEQETAIEGQLKSKEKQDNVVPTDITTNTPTAVATSSTKAPFGDELDDDSDKKISATNRTEEVGFPYRSEGSPLKRRHQEQEVEQQEVEGKDQEKEQEVEQQEVEEKDQEKSGEEEHQSKEPTEEEKTQEKTTETFIAKATAPPLTTTTTGHSTTSISSGVAGTTGASTIRGGKISSNRVPGCKGVAFAVGIRRPLIKKKKTNVFRGIVGKPFANLSQPTWTFQAKSSDVPKLKGVKAVKVPSKSSGISSVRSSNTCVNNTSIKTSKGCKGTFISNVVKVQKARRLRMTKLVTLASYRLTSCISLILARGSVLDFGPTREGVKAAIVNAANAGCLGGGGVDGAITTAGGPNLARDRINLPKIQIEGPDGPEYVRCPTGSAVITGPGLYGDLLVPYVIHAVGPNYWAYCSDEDDADPEENAEGVSMANELLSSAYQTSLDLAVKHNIQQIGFSLLSAGIFRGPLSLAQVMDVSVGAIENWAKGQEASTKDCPQLEVTLCAFSPKECNVLQKICDRHGLEPLKSSAKDDESKNDEL